MTILFLTCQGGIAGSTNSIAFLAEGLARRGHNVVLGCRHNTVLASMLEGTPVEVVDMPFRGVWDRKTLRLIKDTVSTRNIEIINAQSSVDRYASIFARWLYRLPVKIVHTRRQPPLSAGGLLQNLFYRIGTDRIVLVSESLKKIFRKKGFPEKHLRVIYNGTPAQRYESVTEDAVNGFRATLNIRPDEPVIGCISRLKKQEQLIAALEYLDPSYTVLFAGIEPGCLDECIQRFRVKQRIVYAGIVDNLSILAYYPLCSVQVLPSTTDGFGLVLVEAMALGVPVIGTNATGICDVITHGENGLLFTDGNNRDLASCITTMMENREFREQCIRRGKQTALQRFSMERTVDEYERFFGELV